MHDLYHIFKIVSGSLIRHCKHAGKNRKIIIVFLYKNGIFWKYFKEKSDQIKYTQKRTIYLNFLGVAYTPEPLCHAQL